MNPSLKGLRRLRAKTAVRGAPFVASDRLERRAAKHRANARNIRERGLRARLNEGVKPKAVGPSAKQLGRQKKRKVV